MATRARAARAAIALLGLVLVAPAIGAPASGEEAAIGASIALEQSALTANLYNAQADVRVSLSGTVHIETDYRHMVNLQLTLEGTSWARDVSPQTVSRASSGDVPFSAWVEVPRDAPEGSYSLLVRGRDGEPFPIDVHAPFTVSVFRGPLALEALSRTAPPQPGQTASWALVLRNLAPFDLDFDAAFTSPPGFVAHVTPPPIQLVEAGNTTRILFYLDVPALASAGSYEWSVLVTSASHPEVSAGLSAPFEVVRPPPAPPGPGPDFLSAYWLPLSFGLFAAGLALYFSLTEVGYLALSFTLLVPLFTRLRHDKVLDNFTRGQIYGYITANPGAHYSAIQEVLGIENGVLAYHLRVLLREDYLVARNEGVLKRFYPRDYKIPKGRTLLTRLQVDILELVERSPGVAQRDLARALGESKQVISYNVGVLRDAGLVSAERRGRDMCLRPCQGAGDGPQAPAAMTEPHGPDAPTL